MPILLRQDKRHCTQARLGSWSGPSRYPKVTGSIPGSSTDCVKVTLSQQNVPELPQTHKHSGYIHVVNSKMENSYEAMGHVDMIM